MRMMPRLPDKLKALRAAAQKRPLAGARRLESASAMTSAFMSRATIWIDGQRARLIGPGARFAASVPLSSAGDVSAALAAIEALAPKPARAGLHALCVVVGAPFARYYALLWQALPKPDDWVAGARVQAVRAGAGAGPWRYAVSDGAWGRGRLAAAMPEALCAGIERVCKTRRLQLSGIEPGYTFALQKHARRIRDGAIAIVELEETEGDGAIAHIGLRERGGWTGFIALPVFGALDDVLRDAFVLYASEPERRYVIGPGDAGRWTSEPAGIEWLPAPWGAAP